MIVQPMWKHRLLFFLDWNRFTYLFNLCTPINTGYISQMKLLWVFYKPSWANFTFLFFFFQCVHTKIAQKKARGGATTGLITRGLITPRVSTQRTYR